MAFLKSEIMICIFLIIISNEKSYSRFPNQFGSNDISKNVLTNGKENLSIVQMEIFSLWTKSSEE